MHQWKWYLQKLIIFLHHFFLFSSILCLYSWPWFFFFFFFLSLRFQQLEDSDKTSRKKFDEGFKDTNIDFGNFLPLTYFSSCIFIADVFSLQVLLLKI